MHLTEPRPPSKTINSGQFIIGGRQRLCPLPNDHRHVRILVERNSRDRRCFIQPEPQEAKNDDDERGQVEKQNEPAVEEKVRPRRAAHRETDCRADDNGKHETCGDARQSHSDVEEELTRCGLGNDALADSDRAWEMPGLSDPCRQSPDRKKGKERDNADKQASLVARILAQITANGRFRGAPSCSSESGLENKAIPKSPGIEIYAGPCYLFAARFAYNRKQFLCRLAVALIPAMKQALSIPSPQHAIFLIAACFHKRPDAFPLLIRRCKDGLPFLNGPCEALHQITPITPKIGCEHEA